ncbi:fatty-acyl-CoA synthase [Melghirimyces thermohalophilus]|uniref:Fatty-acyl-CoA synthase n=1 Tax=Melghirimyces thermohalophilus TaxID=1236220 RepID=A0A1G6MR22_9BACL|nr:long-chain fatty acid--CoA ligase [Melghirimyces thermohalophilus]SDC57436.1 fatty-acyl-CoA synthase [Melghirimyces thermohalophilus]
MMNVPLLVSSMLERAERLFPEKEVVSNTDVGIFRYNYAEMGRRARRLASALHQLGVRKGDRVGTLAWNQYRHLEAYFAIPGMGAVLHTVNIRLSPEHLVYVINHAGDKVLLVDQDLWPKVEAVRDRLQTVETFVVMTDQSLPDTSVERLYSYEELLKKGEPDFPFPRDLDENDPAGMCYTSATTGKPKGVVYTQRSIYLHSMALGLADVLALSEADTCLSVVPMFHVNAWGLPFAATWFGSKQVLPGPRMTPKAIAELIESEKVTLTGGVPTIWIGMLKELEQRSYDLSTLRTLLFGGSAAPKEMIRAYEEKYGVPVLHAYGMTETSPVVSVGRLKSHQQGCTPEEKLELKSKQGLPVPGVEIRVEGTDGEVAWNGKEIGELLIRGPWIADAYHQDERSGETFQDGWLHTGDMVTVDEEGAIKITDRKKDLIKSGGEWISSVDLENALMAHKDVFEAAVVAIPDPKWQERPVACVVLTEEGRGRVNEEELLEFLRPQVAKWWLPDKMIFMDELPKTSVGKFLKRALREELVERFGLKQSVE